MVATAFAVPQACGQASQAAFASQQVVTDTDAATVTFDLSVGAVHMVTLAGNRTLAVSNDSVCNHFYVALVQDATGSRTVTWWAGIKWAGGAAPTLTTTAAKTDVLEFIKVATGSYVGRVLAANA